MKYQNHISTIIFLFFSSLIVNAQLLPIQNKGLISQFPTWSQFITTNYAKGSVNTNSIISDSSGNTYVVGSSFGSISSELIVSQTSGFIAKYNSSGTLLWTKQFDGTLTGTHNVTTFQIDENQQKLYAIIKSYDTTLENLTFTNSDQLNVSLVKMNLNGDIEWLKILTDEFSSDAEYANLYFDSQSSSLFLSFITNTSINGVPLITNGSSFYFAKLNTDGITQWSKIYGSEECNLASSQSFVNAIQYQAPILKTNHVGQIVIAGTIRSCASGYQYDQVSLIGTEDTFVTTFDSNGNRLSIKNIGASSVSTILLDFTIDDNNNIYLAGYVNGNLGGQTKKGSNDTFIVKVNTSNTWESTTLIGVTGVSKNTILKNIYFKSNLLYLVGYTNGNLESNTRTGNQDIYYAEYTTALSKNWLKLFGISSAYLTPTGLTINSNQQVLFSFYTGLKPTQVSSLIGVTDSFIYNFDNSGNYNYNIQIATNKAQSSSWSVNSIIDSSSNIYTLYSIDGSYGVNNQQSLTDFLVVKSNSNGQVVWSLQKGTGTVSGTIEPVQILLDQNQSDFYVIGNVSANNTYDGYNTYSFGGAFVTKFNSNGDKLWTYLLSQNFGDRKFYKAVQNSDGDLIISGYISNKDFNNSSNVSGRGILIVKITSNGAEQWKAYTNGVNGNQYNLTSLQVDSSNNIYLLANLSNYSLSGSSQINSTDTCIIKFNSVGALQLTLRLAPADDILITPLKLIFNTNGDIMAVAQSEPTTLNGFTSTNKFYFMIKLDTNLNFIQQKNIVLPDNTTSIYTHDTYFDNQFNLYFIGNINGDSFLGETSTNTTNSIYDNFILITDLNGVIKYTKQWQAPLSTANLSHLIADQKGYIYISGQHYSNTLSHFSFDPLLQHPSGYTFTNYSYLMKIEGF